MGQQSSTPSDPVEKTDPDRSLEGDRISGGVTNRDASAVPQNQRKIAPKDNKASLCIKRGIEGNLRRWPVSAKLHPKFAKTIRLCCVFGCDGDEALFVTQDDEVWALGTNFDGCLGTGNMTPCSTPVKITALSGKAVQTFAYSLKHVLALTSKGEIYGWGNNKYSQVGGALCGKVSTPRLVYDGKDAAVEIACGWWHSACRTEKGAVYCWGSNFQDQLGIVDCMTQPTPRRVEGRIANLKCSGISCLTLSTVAVFESGEVYAWGSNCSGELGTGTTSFQSVPVRVDLKNAIIRKVACGRVHTLALASDGSLYTWGCNETGQLGLNHKDAQLTPIRHSRLKETHGRIIEIAVSGDLSAVMTNSSKILMWGSGGTDHKAVPTEVPYESVQDAFGILSSEPRSPVPLIVAENRSRHSNESAPAPEWGVNLLNTFVEQFDDASLSDVKFIVESKTIYAHKTVLILTSEYFRKMFQGSWKGKEHQIIEVDESSHRVYRAFLLYFYTGEMDLPLSETLELLDLANTSCENALKVSCQRHVENMISIENCAAVYSAALRCDAKDLEEFSFRFALQHLTAVTKTEAFAALPEATCKKLLVGAAEEGAFRS